MPPIGQIPLFGLGTSYDFFGASTSYSSSSTSRNCTSSLIASADNSKQLNARGDDRGHRPWCSRTAGIFPVWRHVIAFVPRIAFSVVILVFIINLPVLDTVRYCYGPPYCKQNGDDPLEYRSYEHAAESYSYGLVAGGIVAAGISASALGLLIVSTFVNLLNRRLNLTLMSLFISIISVATIIFIDPFLVLDRIRPAPLWLAGILSVIIGLSAGGYHAHLFLIFGHMIEDFGCIRVLIWLNAASLESTKPKEADETKSAGPNGQGDVNLQTAPQKEEGEASMKKSFSSSKSGSEGRRASRLLGGRGDFRILTRAMNRGHSRQVLEGSSTCADSVTIDCVPSDRRPVTSSWGSFTSGTVQREKGAIIGSQLAAEEKNGEKGPLCRWKALIRRHLEVCNDYSPSSHTESTLSVWLWVVTLVLIALSFVILALSMNSEEEILKRFKDAFRIGMSSPYLVEGVKSAYAKSQEKVAIFACVFFGIILIVVFLSLPLMPGDRPQSNVPPDSERKYCEHLNALRESYIRGARQYGNPFTWENWKLETQTLWNILLRIVKRKITAEFAVVYILCRLFVVYFFLYWFGIGSFMLHYRVATSYGLPVALFSTGFSILLWSLFMHHTKSEFKTTLFICSTVSALAHIVGVCLIDENSSLVVSYLVFAAFGLGLGGMIEALIAMKIRLSDYLHLKDGFREDHLYLIILGIISRIVAAVIAFIVIAVCGATFYTSHARAVFLIMGILPSVGLIAICFLYARFYPVTHDKDEAVRLALCERYAGRICFDPFSSDGPALPPLDRAMIVDFLQFLNFSGPNNNFAISLAHRTSSYVDIAASTGFGPMIVCERCLPPSFEPTLHQHRVIDASDPQLVYKDGQLLRPQKPEDALAHLQASPRVRTESLPMETPSGPNVIPSPAATFGGPPSLWFSEPQRDQRRRGSTSQATQTSDSVTPPLSERLRKFQPDDNFSLEEQQACTRLAELQVAKMKERCQSCPLTSNLGIQRWRSPNLGKLTPVIEEIPSSGALYHDEMSPRVRSLTEGEQVGGKKIRPNCPVQKTLLKSVSAGSTNSSGSPASLQRNSGWCQYRSTPRGPTSSPRPAGPNPL